MAFGVAYHLQARVLFPEKGYQFGVIGLVNVAAARVEHDFLVDAPLFQFFGEVLAHETVGHEHDLVVFQAGNDFHYVSAGDAHVAGRLHVGGGVDVADEGVVRVLFAEFQDLGSGDGVGEATARKGARNQHIFFGVQDFCGFAHELHGGENDGLCRDLGGVLAQLETVAAEVGNAQHDFGSAVAVGENHRVTLLFELVDFVNQREHLLAFFASVGAEHHAGLDGA